MRILASVMLVLATSAFAQAEKEKKPMRVQKMDFTEGSDIEAGRSVPLGEVYLGHQKPGFKSLIKVRMNFDDKLRESVHEM
jgi:hypothetical protein